MIPVNTLYHQANHHVRTPQKKRRENIFSALPFEKKIKQIEVWLNGLVASVISLTRCKGMNNFLENKIQKMLCCVNIMT
ncbi:MAG: hypothetical protein LBH32_02670 [Dysgonamonadaceae bacterium]|jgi:hypothetical protein|nr:hypothetical protein [Dysgonamonadaceae bacterium]